MAIRLDDDVSDGDVSVGGGNNVVYLGSVAGGAKERFVVGNSVPSEAVG